MGLFPGDRLSATAQDQSIRRPVLAGLVELDSPAGDVLVVLTAAPSIDGVLSESDHIRSLYAVRVWRAGHFRQVLISGNTAASIRDFLATQGVPPDRMQVEDQSRSTRESAIHTAPLVRGAGTLVLLTSDYPAYRASRAFARAGVPVLSCPVPDAFKRATVWYMRWVCLLRKPVKLAKSLATGSGVGFDGDQGQAVRDHIIQAAFNDRLEEFIDTDSAGFGRC